NAVLGVQNGINQIFFIVSGIFTQDVEAFTLLRSFLRGDVDRYTIIVRIRFASFRDPEKIAKTKKC
ncbi:4837_t:CDS:1, partial [Ambispora leptoticha]